MHPLFRELAQNLPLAIYLAIGVVFAIYMRQQKLLQGAARAVVIFVAFLWPVILFWMLLLWLQPPLASKRASKTESE